MRWNWAPQLQLPVCEKPWRVVAPQNSLGIGTPVE